MSVPEDPNPTAPLPPHLRGGGDGNQSAFADSVIRGLNPDPTMTHRSVLGTAPPPSPRGRPGPDDDLDATSHPEFDGQPAPTPQPHSELNRFRLLRVIGRGGMGEVWEAVQLRLRRVVALKRMARVRLGSTGGGSSTRVDVFQNEAITAGLLDHPNIVPVYELAYEDSGVPALAMKYVRGRPWIDVIRDDFDLLDEESFLAKHLPVLAQVCQAVAFAHSRGIIHRDLKPSQVMIGDFGEVLLMDWGLAVLVERTSDIPEVEFDDQDRPVNLPTIESAENPGGTPAFMAPEQTDNHPGRLGYHTDVYLLGGILYQLLTGEAPHQAETGAQAWRLAERGIVKPIAEAAARRQVPEPLAELAMHALEVDPANRVPSAREFLDRLQMVMSGKSRREEALKIVGEVSREFERGVREYAVCQALVAALDEAFTLWPQVPGYSELRDSILHRFGSLALLEGDVGVARAAGRAMDPGERRRSLLAEADEVEAKRERTRRRLRAAAMAVAALVTALLIGGSWSYSRISAQASEIRLQLGRTEDARRRAVSAESNAKQKLADSLLSQATVFVEQNRLEEARAALWQVPEPLRNWEWGYGLSRAHPTIIEHDLRTMRVDERRHRLYALDPQGRAVAAPLFGGEAPRVLEENPHEALIVERSRPGGMVVTVSAGGTATVWSGEKLEIVQRFEVGKDFALSNVDISEDPARLVIASLDGRTRVWDARSGELLREVSDFGPGVRFISQSDDGRRFLAATEQNVYVYDTNEGRVAFSRRMSTSLQGAALSPSGRFVACSESLEAEPRSVVRDLETGRDIPLPCFGTTYLFNEAAGILVAADDQWSRREVHVVNLHTGEKRRLMHSLDKPGVFDISARGDRILLGSPERVGVWDTATLAQLRDIPVYGADLERAEFAFHGRGIAVSTLAGRTSLWDAHAAGLGATIEGSYVSITDYSDDAVSIGWSWAELTDMQTGLNRWLGGWAFNPYRGIIPWFDRGGGTALGYDGTGQYTIQAVSGETFATTGEMHLKDAPPIISRDDPAGRLAFVDAEARVLRIVDARQASEVASVPLEGDLAGAVPTGCDTINHRFWLRLADGSHASVDSVQGGAPRVELGGAKNYGAIRFTEGVPLVAGVTSDMMVHVHRLPGGEAQASIQGPKGLAAIVFSAEGNLVALVSAEGECTIARTTDGGTVSEFRMPPFTSAPRCRFLPGGERLFVRAGESARVVDVATGREVTAWRAGFGDLSRDGRTVVLRDGDLRWGITRVAPFRVEDLPGNEGDSWEQRSRAWERGRMHEWIARSPLRQLPSAHRRLRAFDDNTVREAIPLIAASWAISHDIEELAAHEHAVARTLGDLWGRIGFADVGNAISPLDIDRAYLMTTLAESHPELREGPGMALNAVVLSLRLEQVEGSFLEEHSARRRDYEALGQTLASIGETSAALEVFNRGIVFQRFLGVEDRQLADRVAALGGSVPPAPPEDLLFDEDGLTSPVRALVERLGAEGRPTEEVRTEAQALRRGELARAREFAEHAAPLTATREAIARLRARHEAAAFPLDARLRDVAREAEDAAERAFLGGMTWEEALAECEKLNGSADLSRGGG